MPTPMRRKPLRSLILGLQASACLMAAVQVPASARSVEPPVSSRVNDCARAFHAFDTDGDGSLNRDEFAKGKLAQVRFIKAPTPEELATLEAQWWQEAQAMDRDGNGRISQAEYCGAPTPGPALSPAPRPTVAPSPAPTVAPAAAKRPVTVGMGLCPFELCRFGNWQALETLPLYRQEGNLNRTVGKIRPGEAFVTLTGNLYTMRAGEVRLLKAHTMRGPELKAHARGYTAKRSRMPVAVKLKKGSKVEVLTGIGEGYYLVRYQGKVYEVLRFWEEVGSPYKAPGQLRNAMVNEWWVQVRTRNGQQGWIRLTGSRGPAFKILDPVG